MKESPKIEIRECKSLQTLENCVRLQWDIFALPEIELSPVRHFIVTMHAGGFTLGAFHEDKLIGFNLSVPAILKGEKAFYSHMTAVDKDFQCYGIGAKLKWKQRETSLAKDVKFIKWTFQPVMARNAFFNFEKLGAIVRRYIPNFYGTDYATTAEQSNNLGMDSDRLIAEWHLEDEKVKTLATGKKSEENNEVVAKVRIMNDWKNLVETNPKQAIIEQKRIKEEFQDALSKGFICRGFERDDLTPSFLFYNK